MALLGLLIVPGIFIGIGLSMIFKIRHHVSVSPVGVSPVDVSPVDVSPTRLYNNPLYGTLPVPPISPVPTQLYMNFPSFTSGVAWPGTMIGLI